MTTKTLSETTNKKTVVQFDEKGFVTDIFSVHKADKLLQANRDKRNADQQPMLGNTQRHMKHVADIPQALYWDLVKKHGTPRDNPRFWKQWLNDYDNRFFRTSEGSV